MFFDEESAREAVPRDSGKKKLDWQCVAPTPASAPSSFHYETSEFWTKVPPGSRRTLGETTFVLTPAGCFVGLAENDKQSSFLFSSLPAAGHRRERLRKTATSLTILLTIPKGLHRNGPECPERFHHPRSRATRRPPTRRQPIRRPADPPPADSPTSRPPTRRPAEKLSHTRLSSSTLD